MIIIPSGVGVSTRFDIPPEQVLEEQNAEDDDDIHICGACKAHFTDIFLFMRHKSESSCSSSRLTSKIMSVTVPSSSSPSAVNSMFASVGGTSVNSIRPETKYTRIALINTEAFTIQQEDTLKEPTSPGHVQLSLSAHPPQLVLADPQNQRLGLQSEDEPNEDKVVDTEMSLEDDWDSSWSAAKVLGTFSISNSLKRLHKENILKESCQIEEEENVTDDVGDKHGEEHTELRQLESNQQSQDLTMPHEKNKLAPIHTVDDSQTPEKFIGPHGGLLDVEDVEVATLLANHLANEPSLHIYPNATESFLSYSNIQNQLVISDPADSLSFENNVEREKILEPNRKKQKTVISLKSKEPPQQESIPTESLVSDTSSNTLLEKKQKAISKRKIHPCPNEGCNFQGNSVRDLDRHIRKHTGERPFKCTECDKTFSRRDKLSLHIRRHGVVKTFDCKVCEFTCRDQSGLVVHMRRHNDERPYKCQLCDHRSRTKSHLNVHLRKHTGDHPYKCKKCSKAFTTSSDLTRHSKIHTGDKPFSCPHCTYSAALKTSLRTHIQQNHLSGVSLKCTKCNSECQSRKDLRNHLKSHKDDPKRCSKCDFIGSTSNALKTHLKEHLPEKAKQSPLLNGRRGVHRALQKRKYSPKKQRKPIQDFPEVHNCAYCNASFWREDALEEHVGQHQLEELVSAHAPAPQDPVLADSADSRDSTDSTSMDVTCGLAGLAALASYHSASDHTSAEQQPAFLYRYTLGSQSNDNLRNAEILASLNQSSSALPQYVAIQTEQNTLVDALNCIQYVLPSPLGTLDDNDNDSNSSLLC